MPQREESDMNPETLILLQKLLDKYIKENSVEVGAGEYSVDETLTIDLCGTVRKQEDEVFQKTIAVAWKSVMALALARSGAIRPHLVALVKECMIQSITGGPDFKTLIESEIDNIDLWITEINEMVNSGGKGTRTGKTYTTGDLTITNTASSREAV
jgi:hypothetical protein